MTSASILLAVATAENTFTLTVLHAEWSLSAIPATWSSVERANSSRLAMVAALRNVECAVNGFGWAAIHATRNTVNHAILFAACLIFVITAVPCTAKTVDVLKLADTTRIPSASHAEASSTYARFAETTPVRITIFVLLPVRNAKSVSAVTVTRDHTLTNPRMLCALPVTRKQSRRSAFTHSTMMRTTMMM